MRVSLRDACRAVAVRNGGIAFDISGRQSRNACHDSHGAGERCAVALPLREQEPGYEIPTCRRYILLKRIGIGTSQIGAQRGGAVKIVLRVLRDARDQRIDIRFNAGRNGKIGFPYAFKRLIGGLRRGKHDIPNALRVIAHARAAEGIAVAQGQAARAENLAGRRKIRDNPFA